MVPLMNSTEHVKKKKKSLEEGILPDSFYVAGITLIPKPDKWSTKKTNCRPASLNTRTHTHKILNTVLTNGIQEYIKKAIHMTKRCLSWECKAGSAFEISQCDFAIVHEPTS